MIAISIDNIVSQALAISALKAALDPSGATVAISADNSEAIAALVESALSRIVLALYPALTDVTTTTDIITIETAVTLPRGIEPSLRAALEAAVMTAISAIVMADTPRADALERAADEACRALGALLAPPAPPTRRLCWL